MYSHTRYASMGTTSQTSCMAHISMLWRIYERYLLNFLAWKSAYTVLSNRHGKTDHFWNRHSSTDQCTAQVIDWVLKSSLTDRMNIIDQLAPLSTNQPDITLKLASMWHYVFTHTPFSHPHLRNWQFIGRQIVVYHDKIRVNKVYVTGIYSR